jgi:RNA polymerase-binding transcription factor DksA
MAKKATAAAPAKKSARPAPSKGAAQASHAPAKKAAPATKAASAKRVAPAKAAPAKAPAAKSASAKAAPKPAAAKAAPAKAAAKKQNPVPAKRPAPVTVAKSPARTPVKEVTKPVKKADTATVKRAAPAPKTKPKGDRAAFFVKQRELLMEERRTYMSSAEALKAQADSLALEHEPGDVQFDEEGGEGGTANVDREIDLYLSAQARATVVEIDRALQKIEEGTYGVCEQCGDVIPDARLQALPYAALCVSCKSGGLSSRR